jgi:GTP-binding protein
LKAISQAHPKIADYPFTTMNPYIGTIDYQDSFTITVADIPGLVEGASKNKGLGHRFLKHVERNKILVYVVDFSVEDPFKDYEILRKELMEYNPKLLEKQSLIVANKV